MRFLSIPPDWREVRPPPPPYAHALRREYPDGVQVLFCTLEAQGGMQLVALVDHGTAEGTRLALGRVSDAAGLAALVAERCRDWDTKRPEFSPAAASVQRHYFYLGPSRKLEGPISRNEVFGLIEVGRLDWNAELWPADTPSASWRPVRRELGVDLRDPARPGSGDA